MAQDTFMSGKTAKAFLSLRPGDKVLVYDTETTGFSKEEDRIIEFSYRLLKYTGEKFEMVAEDDFYINPGFPIKPEITEINHISDETVKDAIGEAEAAEKIYSVFGNKPIFTAGHNLVYDNGMVRAMYERQGKGDFAPCTVLDTLHAAKELIPAAEIEAYFIQIGREVLPRQKGFYKLETLAPFLKVDEGLTFHRSIDDVKATERLMCVFFEQYKEACPIKDNDFPTTGQEMLKKINKRFSGLATETKGVVPKIKYITAKRFSEKVDLLFIETTTGSFQYNKYNKKWKIRDEKIKTDLDALVDAVLAFTGKESEDDLRWWNPPKKKI